MRSHYYRFVGVVVNPFMCYLAPQFEDSVSSSQYISGVNKPAINSEKLCLLIFVLALAFVAVISPVLCFGSLFFKVQIEGLWYFWFITFSETGYLLWLLVQKIREK